MRTKKNIYIYIILPLLAFCFLPKAWGQYYPDEYEKYEIQNKAAKWYDLRKVEKFTPNREDKFDENQRMFKVSINDKGNIQATHVLIDTIYVHRGATFTLELPDKHTSGTSSIQSYQRWYNLRTGGTFKLEGPINISSNEGKSTSINDLLFNNDTPPVRFKNGYVGQPCTKGSLKQMDFHFPSAEEYKGFTKTEDLNANNANNEYIVACDVSSYTDYTVTFDPATSANSKFPSKVNGGLVFYEPTLSHRFIFCIRTIENTDDWRNKFFTEQAQDKYLEEYEISMPFTRIPDKTPEMVCIGADPQAYAVPVDDAKKDLPASSKLTVTLEKDTNSSGIQLCDINGKTEDETFTLDGTNRIIHFKYPNTNNDTQYGTETVKKDNSQATILVKKTVGDKTFNIARFKLTFKAATSLLTQKQIDDLENNRVEQKDPWANYQYRTPAFLEKHFNFVTGMDFDFDKEIAEKYGQPQVYPYPIGWSESSYGFYDGSINEPKENEAKDFKTANGGTTPQWGYYGILNDYTEHGSKDWGFDNYKGENALPKAPSLINRKGEESTYHMYIDASDRPGTIARLNFDQQLCVGSELFVSAWVKVAKEYNNKDAHNAAMLFTIMGVTDGANGKDAFVPIYRHQTGQIPATFIKEADKDKYAVKNIPGFGSGKGDKDETKNNLDNDNNQWLQVYFSFINETNNDYKRYVLQIDNNSASTAGADMYIDDIRVYIATPKAEVIQKSSICSSQKEDVLLQMRLDWNPLLSRLGVTPVLPKQTPEPTELTTEPSEQGKAHVSFCFVDSALYISKYNEFMKKQLQNGDKEETNPQSIFEQSIIELSYPTQNGKTVSSKIGKLLFDPYYDSNTEYKPKETNIQENITSAKDAGHFYRLNDGQGKSITADIYCALKPFHTYFLVLEENHAEEDDSDGSFIPAIDRFKYFYNEPLSNNSCVAKTSFQLNAQNSIKVNGVLSENSDQTFCNGQIINFGVQLKADTEGTGELKPVTGDVYYDWYLGSLDDFQKETSNTGTSTNAEEKVSIHSALINFREKYREATSLNDWTTGSPTEKTLLTQQVTAGKLILRQANLNAHIKENSDKMFKLVALPIPVELGKSDKITICTDPLEVKLNINGSAPIALVGFDDVKYPDEDTNGTNQISSTIRVSKDILEKCNSTATMLEIPLRHIETHSESTSTPATPSAVDNVSSSSFIKSKNHPHLYLIDSNDPVVLNEISSETFDSYKWPVATLDELKAVPSTAARSDETAGQYLRIHFGTEQALAETENIPETNFREGYWYTLQAYFNEVPDNDIKADGQDTPVSTCEGSLTFNLKVVPEYQKWIGPADGSGNWNNDDNWLRSTADELHMTGSNANSYNNGYNTSGETYYGFVPMSFTKVTIPEGKQVQLYEATPNTTSIGSSDHPILDLAKSATITNPATTHIEYDLMVKEATANGNKVAYNCETYYTNTVDQIHFEPSTAMLHTEYLTYNKAWIDYKLAGRRWYTLASPLQSVVAGDWYTMNTGTQTTEYFEDITFNTTNYNRFQPSVYQRGWKQQANMITIGSSSGKTVAVAGNWSGVYNDVAVPYTPGLGFSVKVLNLSTTTTSAIDPAVALFRFPKADTQYSYYESENNTSGNQVDVRTSETDKDNAGKLKSDELKSGSSEFTITLDESTANQDADYHLIGNPFMAYLSAKKFFDTNTNLQSKYWLVTGDNQTVAVGGTSSSNWITNIGEATTIAPLQSFFVEKKGTSRTTDNNKVTFNADMQALAPTGTSTSSAALKSSSPLPLLTLVATTADGRQSRAVIAYDRTASEEYTANEDAELFLDSNLGDLPSIYTVAGTMAASINRTSVLWNIPVGTYSNHSGNNGNNSETVTLTFEGLDRFTGTTLYDVEKKTETALHDNSSITIAANTYGRYFLRAGTPTGNEKIETETIRIYTIARGQLIVTATENLQTVAIYDFAGRLLRYSDTPSGCLFTTHLGKGNYIVRATSEHQQQTSKIQIR